MNKYKLTNEKKTITTDYGTVTLYRIKALSDFECQDKEVHKGDLGGWVESENNLSQDGNCWVFDDAEVYENAKVYDEAQISYRAKIFDDAQVYGNAKVTLDAEISDNAKVCNNAKIFDYAKVYNNAKVYGSTVLTENAQAYGNAKVYGKAAIRDNAEVCDNVKIYGNAYIGDNAKINNRAEIYDDARVFGNSQVYDDAKVHGDAQVYDEAQVYSDAEVYDYAEVYDTAKVSGDAKVYGEAQIYGNAFVYSKAQVSDFTRIFGDAEVYGNAKVYGHAEVYNHAKVFEDAKVYGEARVRDNAKVYGNAEIYNKAKIYDNAEVYGDAKVYKDAEVYNVSQIYKGNFDKNTRETLNNDNNLKYKLTDETLSIDDEDRPITLHRIEALRDFICQGRVVLKGDKGGWVESEDNLSQDGDCWLFDEAKAYGNAMRITGDACLFKNSFDYRDAPTATDYEGTLIISGGNKCYNHNYMFGYTHTGEYKTKIYGNDEDCFIHNKKPGYNYGLYEEVYNNIYVQDLAKMEEFRKKFNNIMHMLSTSSAEEITAHKEEIAEVFPRVSEMFGFDQNSPSHQYDLWEHTAHVIEAIRNDKLKEDYEDAADLYLAALYHDIGKLETGVYDAEKNKTTYIGHADKSVEILKNEIFPYLKEKGVRMSNDFKANVVFYTAEHEDRLSLKAKSLRRQLEYETDGIKPATLDKVKNLEELSIADCKAHIMIPLITNQMGIYDTLDAGQLTEEYKIIMEEALSRKLVVDKEEDRVKAICVEPGVEDGEITVVSSVVPTDMTVEKIKETWIPEYFCTPVTEFEHDPEILRAYDPKGVKKYMKESKVNSLVNEVKAMASTKESIEKPTNKPIKNKSINREDD